MRNICKLLFCDFSFTDLSWVRQRKQAFSALTIGKVGRFWASCCLSLGHNARIAPISFSAQTFSALLHFVRNLLRRTLSKSTGLLLFSARCRSAHRPTERYRKPLAFFMLIVLRNAIESHWLSSCSNLLENRLKIPRNQFLEVTSNYS